MAQSESLGFVLLQENSDFENIFPKPKKVPATASLWQDYDQKYPKRVSLQASSSELAIISTPKGSPKFGEISKQSLKSVRSKNPIQFKENNPFTDHRPRIFGEDQPIVHNSRSRPSRLRQRHTFKPQPVVNIITEIDEVRRKSQKCQSSANSQGAFKSETQKGGRVGEAIFRSKKCSGKLNEKYSKDSFLSSEKEDQKEAQGLADFCKLEELAKLLAEDQALKNFPAIQQNPKTESSQVCISESVPKIEGNNDNCTNPRVNTSERLDCTYEKEWKQALERIQQLEISKKILDAEIQTLREDLSKAQIIIFEKSQLLERVNPKEGPTWMVPSEENIFKMNVDYFSLRTFNENSGFAGGKTYSAKLYMPGGSSGNIRKQNKVSFQLPEVDDKVFSKFHECNEAANGRMNSAPPGRTYVNIRRRQMKLINPEPKCPSKKSSLQCFNSERTQFEEKCLKARSVPLNSKLCSKMQDKLEKTNFGNSTGNNAIKNNPIANMEYLAIALASREGLIREIAHSVRKAKKILHFRFKMLISSDFASADLHFLLTSHRRFLRWLNNYISYSTNLVNRFDDKYMKSRRFFLPATVELENETLKGIFIPVPDHGDKLSPSPEYVEKSAQTNLATSSSPIQVSMTTQTTAVQALRKHLHSEDKSIQVQTVSQALENFQGYIKKIRPPAEVADKSTLAFPPTTKLAEKYIQTLVTPRMDPRKPTVSYMNAEKFVQTKRSPELFHQSNQTPPCLISKTLRTRTVQIQTLQFPCQVIKPSVNHMTVQTYPQEINHVVSMQTQTKTSKAADISDSNSNKIKNSYYAPDENDFINSSKSIQVSFQDDSKNLKPALSTRNVAFQHFQCQSPPLSPLLHSTAPASVKLNVVNQPSVQVDSKTKSRPRISFNLQNLTSEQKLATPKRPTLDLDERLARDIGSPNIKKRMATSAVNFFPEEDDHPELNSLPEKLFPMEELWPVPKEVPSSDFSESLGLFPGKNLPKAGKNQQHLEYQDLNMYEPLESNSSFNSCDANPNENRDDLEGGFQLFKLNLPKTFSARRSPLNFVSEFQEETAERFYNHRGNAHLRVLNEEKIIYQEARLPGDVGRSMRSVHNNASGTMGSTIEELTNFFEETVAKYKKKKSNENLEEPLPKFKSAAEVVLDILSKGQDGLYQIESDECLLKKESDCEVIVEESLSERFSGILENDSKIFEIDPEYEAMFNLAVQEIPNVDEEFERIFNGQVSMEFKSKISETSAEQDDNRFGDVISHVKLEPTIKHKKRRCTGFEGDVPEKPRSRVSRLPVRVGPGRVLQKSSKTKLIPTRVMTPGITEEPIPIQFKSKLLTTIEANPGKVSKSKERKKSLIPVKAKPAIRSCENCPVLAQSSVKRVEKVTTQAQSGIRSNAVAGTIKDGLHPVKKRVTSFENPVRSQVHSTQRKSFSKMCPCRKTKVSTEISH